MPLYYFYVRGLSAGGIREPYTYSTYMPAADNIPAYDTAMGLTDAELDDILGLFGAPAAVAAAPAPYSEAALLSEFIDELIASAVELPAPPALFESDFERFVGPI